MTIEKQIFAYKELRNNGQVFVVDNYEDADRIIEALEKLECLNEIAHIFLEHRAWGEYPSSADDMWEETIRVLDKYKIEIGGE